MGRLDRVAVAGRTFTLAAILGLTGVVGTPFATQSVMLLAGVAVVAAVATGAAHLPGSWVAVAESCLVGLTIGLARPDSVLLLPYLVVPVLIAALYGGLGKMGWALSSEVGALVAITWLPPGPAQLHAFDVTVSWLVAAVGAGLLGAHIHQMHVRVDPAEQSYRNANELLGQLHALAPRLSTGLDPVEISRHVLQVASADLSASQGAVFTRSESGTPTPVQYTEGARREDFWQVEHLVHRCWHTQAPVRAGTGSHHRTALPIRVGARMVGVLVADSAHRPDDQMVTEALGRTASLALRLDTAQLFAKVRAVATAEERRRLAREVHDGIAQDVASLGYLVDELAESATDASQRDGLRGLRGELTNLVSELRLSIFDLRSEVEPSAGIGAALSDYVHRVGSRSSMKVHLSLDESPTRLRPEVETELLRIAQEAIANARKHAAADNLWVDCRVAPPFARLQVRDDGRGLGGAARNDSYGLGIMRERAERIGARLDLASSPDGAPGTRVTVVLGDEPDQVAVAAHAAAASREAVPCPQP